CLADGGRRLTAGPAPVTAIRAGVRQRDRGARPLTGTATAAPTSVGSRRAERREAPRRVRAVGAPDGTLELLARLVPVVEELLEADVRQRVLHELLEHGERQGRHVRPRLRGVDDVQRAPDRRGEYLRLEAVVPVDLDDVADQVHPDV